MGPAKVDRIAGLVAVILGSFLGARHALIIDGRVGQRPPSRVFAWEDGCVMSNAPIEREVLRDALFEALRRGAPEQYSTLQQQVAQILVGQGLPTQDTTSGYPSVRGLDQRRFREIVWQLINQGVLVQGINEYNPQWPWLSLTEWGEEYVRSGGADVYDPDGYLAQLEHNRPLDNIERQYLSQASAALRADLPDASAVMLGAAAEHLLIRLAEQLVANDAAGTAKIAQALVSRPSSCLAPFGLTWSRGGRS